MSPSKEAQGKRRKGALLIIEWTGCSFREVPHLVRRRALLDEDIRAAIRPGISERKIQTAAERLLSLAA